MKKKVLIVVFILSVGITTRLFVGVYEHDEFAETDFFIKHRPTWKWRFYSPIGMSDLRMEDLSKEEQTEQQYFNEFVRDRGLSR
ncbi:hypothetical protein [Flavobacterium foetidum]|uniref:hypothetical protein n=1 Tax=Flavobacterium foetidum TaxID=2026681 RepID=UPI0010751079|nr:hypothetical protein [Flavobacterium foetidum]KAF2515188.1 hypothetical protein E0W73_09605 [Flavobacterium foetidum]